MRRALPQAVLIFAAVSLLWPQDQPSTLYSNVIDSPSPLHEVAQLFNKRYHKAVTYEESVLVWRGDLVRGRFPEAPMGLWQKDRHFVIPSGLDPQHTGVLNLAMLRAVVESYNKQNSDGPLYKATESQFGLHILPLQMRDANGEIVEANSLLDTRVTVASALRMPSEQIQALCDAVTAAGNDALQFTYARIRLDIAFAPNGLLPPRGAAQLLSANDKEPFSIVWGTSGVTAREALVDLIHLSQTKLTWYLLCQPSARRQDRFCVLNLDDR
jgi:hypothetical protein